MKKDLYLGKYLSFHNTCRCKECFELDLLPSIVISDWRIMIGWLCFKLQITYEPKLDEELWHE